MKHLLLLLPLLLGSCVGPMYPTGVPEDSRKNPDSRPAPRREDPEPQGRSNYPDQQPVPQGAPRPADKGITIRSIRLTQQGTVLSLTFTNRNRVQKDENGSIISDGSERIAFRPSAVLIAGEGTRQFKFIRGGGLPIGEFTDIKTFQANAMNVPVGKSVDFEIVFERLDPGLEDFDLFECNDFDHLICWNIYNLHVDNPLPPIKKPDTRPTKPATRPRTGKVGEVDNTPPKPVEPPVVPIALLTGVVRNAKTNQPISATIDFHRSGDKAKLDSVQSFASTGLYKMSLPKGQVYTYLAFARGYTATNDVLDLSKTKSGETVTRDIYLNPLAVGDKITLKNIYFEVSKSELLKASFAELNKLVAMMQENPGMAIRLEGHTDIVGDHDANQELSQDRVDACRDYLVSHGIQEGRIEAVGYGDTRPLVKKGTDEERKVNRRVEFIITRL
ncbi:MAG: OmpA family protein [Siphonobacter aquaeclarae]|nr:OmpA family protein [Siphonobacter aquaeclarae]